MNYQYEELRIQWITNIRLILEDPEQTLATLSLSVVGRLFGFDEAMEPRSRLELQARRIMTSLINSLLLLLKG